MSLRDPGSDDGNCGQTDGDPAHRAICTAVGEGITFAVSAGNDRTDSSRWIPAAYPEVITVSALADLNGQPGGGGARTCSSFGGYDVDDTFADFSNYGPAVDIIAPGKCIVSTFPTTHDSSGYRTISGTSMASPHVAGAIALYKVLYPDATPADVRAGLLAAGTQNWTTSSDPDGRHEPLLNVSNLSAVPPSPDFAIEVSPNDISPSPGGSATATIDTSVLGIGGTVKLTASIEPADAGVEASLTKTSIPAGSSSVLTVTADSEAAPGSYTATITGTEGSKVHAALVSVRVPAGTPSPQPSPGSNPGGSPAPTPTPGAKSTYVPLTPNRILDSRYGTGVVGRFQVGIPRSFQVTNRHIGNPSLNVPGDAVAVTGNLTVAEQTWAGWLTISPTTESRPLTSTLNFPVNDIRANGVTVPLGPGGTLSVVYNGAPSSATTHAVFDVTGYFVPGTSGAKFVSLTPNRVLDTRAGTGLGGVFRTDQPRTLQVTNRNLSIAPLNVPAEAVAVTANLTVTSQTGAGWLSITPDKQTRPATSTLNFPVGDNRANGLTVPLGPGGTLSIVYNGGPSWAAAHVVLDVTGYFLPGSSGASYVPLMPNRILDSRSGNGLGGKFRTDQSRSFTAVNREPGKAAFNVPATAVAVTGNLTVAGQTRAGWLTVTPTAQFRPPTSTLNFPRNDNRANGLVVALGSGGTLAVVYNGAGSSETTHAIFDVTGYFAP
jgi:hypothetical protein